jgi:hypothetical protein
MEGFSTSHNWEAYQMTVWDLRDTVSSHCCESQYWNMADYMAKLELVWQKFIVVNHNVWIKKVHHMGTTTCVSMPRQLLCIDVAMPRQLQCIDVAMD